MKPSLKSLFILVACASAAAVAESIVCPAAELRVGAGEAYANPSDALREAKDGDTVIIGEGVWKGDIAYFAKNGLTVRGSGAGKTVLDADGKWINGKGIWVVAGTNCTVEGIEFKNAVCPDRNGAGIRYEGNGDIAIRNCAFIGNENGILCGVLENATMTIEGCLFRDNGYGDGFSHNLYIGRIKELVFRNCVSDHCKHGHNLKSRALKTTIEDSVFDDGHDGVSSYLVNCPNGGVVSISRCKFVQSETADNSTMVSVGEEGAYPGSTLLQKDNSFTDYRNVD